MSRTTEPKLSLKRDQIIKSWRKFAPDATFANLTLAEFELDSKKPLDVRSRIRELQTELKGTLSERNQADEEANDLFVAVANSIRGTHGLNSPLYRSLGYVPKAERKRPQRKAKNATTAPEADPPAEADAA
jgi:hypothetical protein